MVPPGSRARRATEVERMAEEAKDSAAERRE